MKIRVQSGGIMNPPQEVTGVDSVVIMTDDDTPLAAALTIDNAVWVKTIAETGFAEIMEELGFDKRNLPKVHTLDVP